MDRVGQQFGDYRLIRLIGQGGFAAVYLGEHSRRKTPAAVKVLHTRLANDNVKAFLNEARSFRLRHPHIVQIIDFGLEDDFPFLVMEYAPNGSLRQCHPRGTQLPLDMIVSNVRQITDALQYAHDEGVVHRDIKPDNMLLGRQNEVLLSDFGIASIAHSTQSMDVQDQAGTINYMAPEQLQGKPRPASDQYALGVVVYEWICGERPFQGTFAEIFSQHLSVPPPLLRERVPTLPLAVEEVVMTALAKDPRSRFAKVSMLANALEQACRPVPPACLTTIFPVTASVLETSDVVSPLNNPLELSPIIIPSLNDSIPTPVLGRPSNILAQVPDQVASTEGATDLQDPVNKEASITGERNRAAYTETKSYEDKSTTPEADFRSDVVEPPSSNPKKINFVPVPAKASFPQTEPEKYTPRDVDILGNGKRSTPFRRKRGRIWLFSLLIITVVMLIAGFAIAVPGRSGSIAHILPGVSTTPKVTITPKSQTVSNTFAIVALTSAPDPNKREVAARILKAASPAQSMTVDSTGSIPGARATGALTFLNSTGSDKSFGSVILRGASGVPLTFNGPITVFANPGFQTITGFAVNIGSAGNIGALDISGSCCAAGITVKNGAFGGGQDPLPNSVVQQSDINGAADALTTSLTPGTQSDLQKQVKPNEQVVPGTFKCSKSTFNANHKAGDRAPDVTVTVVVTCTEEVYDQQAALTMVANLLKAQASKDPGAAYALTGNIVTGVTKATVLDTRGTVSLLVSAQGVWVYQFSDVVKQDFANHIANKSEQDAKKYLLGQPGVSDVKIVISSGTTLPDASHNTIEIVAIPGATGTPTVTPGSPSGFVTPLSTPPLTPTPTQGLGGS